MRTRAPAVVGLLAAASLGLTACADLGGLDLESVGDEGKTTYIKLALNQAETHPSYIALANLSDRFEEATDGRWKIEVFPNEQLGSQQEVLQFVKSGAIEMAIVSGTQLENMNKDFQVLNMPTTFSSIEHQMNVIRDQDLMEPLFQSLADTDNISVIGGFTQGTRNLYTSDGGVVTPADLAGQKIRVQESAMHIRMIELMGGSATPLSYGEVYTAIQSGVLDGAENNEVSYVTQNHHEVARFHSNTEHLVGLDYMVMRDDLLDAMDDADRELFLQEWDAAMDEHTDLWNSETDAAIERAKASGAEFVQVDEQAFAEALAPIRDEFLTNDFQRGLYDAVRDADTGENAS
ncbi:2,3-diketo-L-gulonate-binding periplasmic protein YiaO precursor [Corynebacterium faecale]|uniref:TRAP transporter substrate-binding protein n=1 Tax=Corynebacterium faecale TaxID=1758466 RepID=UPI0025B2A7FB|nr:TRAP transporter substrate-binding protein [Corynebacterium faecale]WJY92872.1 2,3-diketo-L-gulonate-binding periplasmic protein YiaO precursor [Corynebacterium faecale]